MRREVPPVLSIWIPLDGEERMKKRDGWLNASHDIDNQKTNYKPKGIWNNHINGKAIEVEDVKDERENRKPQACSKCLLIHVEPIGRWVIHLITDLEKF